MKPRRCYNTVVYAMFLRTTSFSSPVGEIMIFVRTMVYDAFLSNRSPGVRCAVVWYVHAHGEQIFTRRIRRIRVDARPRDGVGDARYRNHRLGRVFVLDFRKTIFPNYLRSFGFSKNQSPVEKADRVVRFYVECVPCADGKVSLVRVQKSRSNNTRRGCLNDSVIFYYIVTTAREHA